MGSSSRCAAFISLIACWIFFFIIFFQLPLFRVPCRIGICTTPIEVTSSQLIATEFCPPFIVKALLYPGAIAEAFIKKEKIPSFDKILKLYNLNHLKKGITGIELHRLEILAGCYLTVAGAVLGILRPGRMSLIGTLVMIWGFIRESMLRKSAKMNPTRSFSIYPAMSIAVLCACLSIRKDVRKLIRCFSTRSVAKSLRSKSKNVKSTYKCSKLDYVSVQKNQFGGLELEMK